MANTYGLNVIKIGGILNFPSAPLIGWGAGLLVTCDAHFRTRKSYYSQKSCVKIWFGLVEPFKSYHLNFPLGQKPPIRGDTCDLRRPFSNLAELFQSKVMCENLVRIGRAFQELSCPQTFFFCGGGGGGGAETPIRRGLYVTCDAHFRTRTCYSSQKSCVKIWFGLVEIGGVHFQGGQKPPIRGVTCDLRCHSSNLAELFQSKVMCKNLVRIG